MVLNPIIKNYRKLSKSEKIVGDFILDNPGYALSKNAVEVAQITHTSPATIGRFAQKIGFKNYFEARMNLVKNEDKPLQEIADDMALFVTKGDDLKRCGNKLLGQISSVCTSAYQMMDFDQLDRAIGRIEKARTIYLAGVGTSSVVAQSLYIKFHTVGLNVEYSLDPHIDMTSILVGGKEDVLIAFSFSGTTSIIKTILAASHEKGIFTIGVTGNLDSSFARSSDIVLQSPAMEQETRIGAVSSLYSQIFVADLLFLGYISKNYDKTKEAVTLNNLFRKGLHNA